MQRVRRGFTLVEMLVVIGIIVILVASVFGAYSSMTKRALRSDGAERVYNALVALNALYLETGSHWPRVLLQHNNGQLDERTAIPLAAKLGLKCHKDKETGEVDRLSGVDRCGVVTPWASRLIKRLDPARDPKSVPVPPAGRPVSKHVLYYAIDTDGDGITEASVGGEQVRVRASAAVWCIGPDGGDGNGDPWPYSVGVRKGDLYSWTPKQTEGRR